MLPPNKRLETIFLVIGDAGCDVSVNRQPSRDLKGSVQIHGDILNTAPAESWNLPQ